MTSREHDAPAQTSGVDQAEYLVVEGLRRWLAGYATGSIECWELAWRLYAERLGQHRAGPAVSALSCFARTLNAHSRDDLRLFPYECPRFCKHECLSLALLGAWQIGERDTAAHYAEALVTQAGLPEALETGADFAQTLISLNLQLPFRPPLAPHENTCPLASLRHPRKLH